MKSKFNFFAAVALVMATSCAKTFNVGNDKPVRGDQDEIRFSSYVNVMTKSGTKATETFDPGDGFVVIGGYEIGSAIGAYVGNVFSTTRVFNVGTAAEPVWTSKEIPSDVLEAVYEQFIESGVCTKEQIEAVVEELCYNSNFKASWPLATALEGENLLDAFDAMENMSWEIVHKYWNYNTEGQPYQFMALSPASLIYDAALELEDISLEPHRNLYMDGELDPLYAYTSVPEEDFGDDVELDFSHLGAKLEFKINNACADDIDVYSAALGGTISKEARLTSSLIWFFLNVPDADDQSSEPKYHFYIPYITEEIAAAMEEKYGVEPGYIRDSGFDVYSVPGTILAGNSMPASFVVCPQSFDPNQNSVMLAYTLGDDPYMYTVEIPLSDFKFSGYPLRSWTARYKYTYNITINHDGINFSVSIDDWQNGGEGTVVVAGE